MKSYVKKTIITNDLINGNRFITKETLSGNFVINYKVVTPIMLIASLMDINTRLISNKEASYILFKLIREKDDNYNFSNRILTVGSASKLLEVINDYRLTDDFSFKNILNGNYIDLLKDYENYLKNHNLIDYVFGLDYIKENNIKINGKAILLDDLELSKKEKDVINYIFNYNVENTIAKKQKKEIRAAYSCYGVYNELLNVLDIIKDNNYALGDCELVYTSNIYENFIRGLFDSRKISYAMTNIHGASTNLISFMIDILTYYRSNFKYELLESSLLNKGVENIYLKEFYDSLKYPKIIIGFGYDRTKQYINSISSDDSKKNIREFLTDLIGCFNNDFNYLKFIDFSYKYIKSEDEKKALESKLKSLSHIIDLVNDNEKLTVTSDELLNLIYSEADDNSILASPISKRLSLRKNLFIIGLSQNYVSGSDIENPFIIDPVDYSNDLGNGKYLHILKNTRNNIVEALNYYLDYSASENIYLSYPSFNKIDLRPSSMSIFFMEKTSNLSIKEINKYDIQKENMKFNDLIISDIKVKTYNDYSNGRVKKLSGENRHLDSSIDNTINEKIVDEAFEYSLSPSSIQTLLQCPYNFYYQKFKKLPYPEYPSLNEHEWLDSNARGTFFHRVLELYARKEWMNSDIKSNIDEASFTSCFTKALDEALVLNPVKSEVVLKMDIEEIMAICRDYIEKSIDDFKTNYRVLDCEYNLLNACYKYSKDGINISFSGFVDRVDGYIENDTLHLRLVDYKTGKYKNKDESSYIQHIIYSICLKDGLKNLFNKTYSKVVIDEFIYDYVFDGKENRYNYSEIESGGKIIFNYIDKLVITYLNNGNYIEEFDNYFIDNMTVFEGNKDYAKTICDYCKYKSICIKRLKEGKEWITNKS